jgi:hypothetical protein
MTSSIMTPILPAKRRDPREHLVETLAEMDEQIDRVVKGEIDPNAARVAFDAHKWQAARENQNLFGDRTATEVSGPNGGPLEIQETPKRPMIEIARRIVFLMQRATDGQNGGPQHLLVDSAVR